MKIGNLDISSLKVGSSNVDAVYLGNDLVYNNSGKDYSLQYLTFVPTTAASTFQFSQTGLSYSLDSGSTWTSLAASTNTPSVSVGNKIMFKANLNPTNNGIGKFTSSDKFDVEGNVMSLLYGDDFSGQTSLNGKNYAFINLFSACTTVVSAENLILPATTLSSQCYKSMFRGCTSLETAPLLPATTLADYCYQNMFVGCSGLTTAPELPATTLATACYGDMFSGCRGLTVAPQLPATILADRCYQSMFSGCSGLTVAPQLPATTLTSECYHQLFINCTSLNSITCLATDISASNCLYNWVYRVASNGTFTKAASMESWTIGNKGIPTNWTVLDYSE